MARMRVEIVAETAAEVEAGRRSEEHVAHEAAVTALRLKRKQPERLRSAD